MGQHQRRRTRSREGKRRWPTDYGSQLAAPDYALKLRRRVFVALLAQRAGELNSTRVSSDASARDFSFSSEEGTPSFG